MKNKVTLISTFVILLLCISQLNGQSIIAKWNFSNVDADTPDEISESQQADMGDGTISLHGANFSTWVAGGSDGYAPSANNWNENNYWQINISTEGYKKISLSSKQSGSNTGPRDFKLQYSLNGTDWNSFDPVKEIEVANNWTTGKIENYELSEACDDQENLYLRWIMTSEINIRAGSGSYPDDDPVQTAGTNRIDEIIITGKSNKADILSFTIDGIEGNVISATNEVTLQMPFGTNLTELTPVITISEGATIDPESEVSQDFTETVIYVVTAEDEITQKNWHISVTTLPNTEAEILTFSIDGYQGNVISATNQVTLEMPYGTDLTELTPTITISEGASVSPESGVAQDFSNQVIYTVTAENQENLKNWTVTVSEKEPNNEAEILAFLIDGYEGNIISATNEVSLEMPFGTDLTELIPTITISEGASISPDSEVTQDFTDNIIYIVTAEDQETSKNWSITVTSQEFEVTCPDDIAICINEDVIELTGANPEGGIYSGTGVSDGIFNPETAGADEHTIIYSYEGVECSFTITVNEMPAVVCPANFKVEENEIVVLAGIGENPEGGIFTGVGVSDGEFDPEGLDNGDYTIIYTFKDIDTGCENFCEFTITVDIDLWVQNQTVANLSVFPNPNEGVFVIKFNNNIGKVNYTIYDTKGSVIISDKFVNYENNQKEINIDVPAGTYFIKIDNNDISIIEKLIIK